MMLSDIADCFYSGQSSRYLMFVLLTHWTHTSRNTCNWDLGISGHISELTPNNGRLHLYKPLCVTKVVICCDSGLSSNWWSTYDLAWSSRSCCVAVHLQLVWAGVCTMYYGLVRSSHIDAETEIFSTSWCCTSDKALWIPNLMTTEPTATALTFCAVVPFTPLLTRRSRFFIDPVCVFFTRFTRTEIGRLVGYTFTIFYEFCCACKSKLFLSSSSLRPT